MILNKLRSNYSSCTLQFRKVNQDAIQVIPAAQKTPSETTIIEFTLWVLKPSKRCPALSFASSVAS